MKVLPAKAKVSRSRAQVLFAAGCAFGTLKSVREIL